MLTREQTQKAVEELKANEWMALGGMSPEAQEFVRENANKSIWGYPIRNGKKCVGVIEAVSFGLYRLDSSYTLPEEEPEYLELDVFEGCHEKSGENILLATNSKGFTFDISTPLYKMHGYQLEGFKFEGWDDIWNLYTAWCDPNQKTLIFGMKPKDSWYKKVFASKVVYRKVG
jgi:hypothetical protein